jgi:hypothetical protein
VDQPGGEKAVSGSRQDSVQDFLRIPGELKAVNRWECWKYINGDQVPIDVRSGRRTFSDGFGVPFSEAVEYFISHEDIEGIFFRLREHDPSNDVINTVKRSGVTYTHVFLSPIDGRKRRR